MIIKCDKCSTKFRLDDSRITGNGVKVRCTKCQNVFIVTPPPAAEEVQLEEVFGVGAAASARNDEMKKGGAAKGAPKKEEDRRNLAFDFEEENDEKRPEETKPDFGSFSEDEFEKSFEATRTEEPQKPAAPPAFDNIDFSFSEERTEEKDREEGWGAPADGDMGLDGGEAKSALKDDDDFSFDIEETEEPAPRPAKGAEELWEEPQESAADAPMAKAPAVSGYASGYTRGGRAEEQKSPVALKEPDDAESDEAAEDFKEVLAHNITREDLPSFSDHVEDAPVRKERSGNMGLVAAILIIVLGGGFVYYTGVIDKLARTLMPPATSQLKTVEIETIKGFYEENKNFGKLFVIEARVKNITGEPQPIKAATGIIYNDDGDKIGSRSVSPGRIVTMDDVRNMPLEDLQRAFKDPSGGIIPPKGTVPVMVIFTDAEGVAEYGLDIVR